MILVRGFGDIFLFSKLDLNYSYVVQLYDSVRASYHKCTQADRTVRVHMATSNNSQYVGLVTPKVRTYYQCTQTDKNARQSGLGGENR